MSLKDKMEVTRTNALHPTWMPVRATMTSENITPNITPPMSYNEEYRLMLTVSATFRAPQGAYDQAKRVAERRLFTHLYGDARVVLDEIIAAVMGHDEPAALEACAKMREALDP